VDELSEADAKEILSKAPGITIVDDRVKNDFPTPLGVSNKVNYPDVANENMEMKYNILTRSII
jgi:hypothetical protein